MSIKKDIRKILKSNIFILVSASLVFRILLSFFGTLELDFNTFFAWSARINEVGFARFYEAWSDYLPGYLYVLWLLGKINALVTFNQTLLYKSPAIIADIATGIVIYKIVKKYKNEKIATYAAAFYLFNPAIIANSTLWGQVDSLTSLFSLLAVWLASSNVFLSVLFLSIGAAVKPQAVLAAFVVLFIMARDKWPIKRVVLYIALGLIFFLAIFYPFAGNSNLPLFVIRRLQTTLNQYPYTSINAFNFWGFFGFWISDSGGVLKPGVIGVVVTSALAMYAGFKLQKKKAGEYYFLAILFALNFLLFTRIHERHLLPIFAPLVIVSALEPYYFIAYFGLSFTYVLNLYYAFVWITQDFRTVLSSFWIKILILINLGSIAMLYLGGVFGKIQKFSIDDVVAKTRKVLKPSSKNKENFSKLTISKKRSKYILLAIVLFSFVTRVYSINKPSEEYFDEVYHAFTAKVILHNDPKAWEWWNPHPEGFAYEWTHPPIAKEMMVAGMLVFGERSLGWRIPGVILGILSVLLIYLIAKKVFKDEALALLSAAFFSLGGLPIVMSRIGMNDVYLVFFGLLSIHLFLKDKYFFSSIALGLALATKWSGVWLIPILLASHFVFKKKLRISYIWFAVIPFAVYLASYIPMFTTGHDVATFIEMQKQMWWYHTGLDATHPFTSPWYSWPILARPIWLYTSDLGGGKVSNIYATGNPVVFWFGLFSVLLSTYFAVTEKNKKLAWVVFSYLIFFVPWALSPRIMFLYHYYPSVPFMAIATGYVLRRFRKLIVPVFILALITLIYFYPRFTGIPVSTGLDTSYRWFEGW